MPTKSGRISVLSWVNDMAKLEFGIGCSLETAEDTAELALKAVNLYCNKNDLMIEESTYKDRTGTKMKFVPRPYDFYEKRNEK